MPIGEQYDLSHYIANSKPMSKEQLLDLNSNVKNYINTERTGLRQDVAKVDRLLQNIEHANQILTAPTTEEEKMLVSLTQENFPVVYMCTAADTATVSKPISDHKYEFGFKDGLSLENIVIILVPKLYVPFVRRMYIQSDVHVASLDNYFDISMMYRYSNDTIKFLDQKRDKNSRQGIRHYLARFFTGRSS